MAKPLFSSTICVVIAVLHLLHSATVTSGVGEVCNLGNTEVPETSFLDSGGQYLDFRNPANCTGNVIAWHFCYYAADIAESGTYAAQFRIWRMTDGNNYQRIHDYDLRMVIDPPSNGETLLCETATLSTPLNVQENDILGTFISPIPIGVLIPLHIIASGTDDFGLLADTRNGFTAAFSDTLSTDNLEGRTNLGLHLYADIAVDCVDLDDPMNGQVVITPDAMATFETDLCAVATYTCSEGYSLDGDVMRTCQANGQWDGAEPSCTLIDCGGLTVPEGGQVTFTPGVVMTLETGLGAVANYTCDSDTGYMLPHNGPSPIRTCQDNGQWSGVATTCTRCDFSTLSAPDNGSLRTLITGGEVMASYTCDMGYRLVGDVVLTCQSADQFSGEEPTCDVINCGLLPLLSEGQVAYTPGVVTGLETGLNAVASYTCSEGYNLVGDMTRTCQANGQWDGGEPTCMLIDCGGLNVPEGGDVTITPGVGSIATGLDAVATYTCSEGYDLVGNAVRTCQASGQWDVAAPNCMLIDCGGLRNPENGQVIISPGLVTMTGVGAVATYTCNTSAGFMLVGTVMRTCQDSGRWSGMVPECIPIDCGEPPTVDDGSFNVTETTFQSMARYGCNEGFTLSGSQSRTCQADGTWSGTDPVCVAPGNSSPAIAAGVVVGLVVAALIALGIIVVIILRRRRQRKGGANIVTGSSGNRFEDLSNPIYSGEIDGRYVGIAGTGSASLLKSDDYDEVAESNGYEMAGIVQPAGTLTSTDSDYDDIADPHRSSNLVIANPSPMESQHYELPARRNIYSTMSDRTMERASSYEEPVESSRNHSEWGIHVPTKEQREVLTMSRENSAMNSEAHGTDENVYAALKEVQRATLSSTPMTFFEESDTYWAPSSNPSELYEQLAVKKYREIPRNHIQIVEHLGAGQFGTVNKGTWQTAEKTVEIAVKMLKVGAGENDKVKFLQEAAINGQFRHPNVVKLLGVVTVGNPVMIVLEYLSNGDLKSYLTKQRPVPGELPPSQMPSLFLGFCQQVARGMEYLSQKAFIHRDLAARNVLVSENKICKISDFGMSRDLSDESYYVAHGGKIPVKWTAPEALHFRKYTTASDVWSYGAVMYEIWSLGYKPFKGYTNQEAMRLVDDGYRLPPPPGCPKKLYSLMIQCWNPEKFSRPSFPQIVSALSESELELLCWTERDTEAHPQAMLLGAPLEAGGNLYPELQGAYK